MNLGNTEKSLLKEIAGLEAIPAGAYNVRENGKLAGRNVTAHIDIVTKKDKPGIDIYIKSETKGERVDIPVILTETGLNDLVYNDFYVADGADVTIVAGCGIHNAGGLKSEHDGIHAFHIGKNAKVLYIEKHYGEGDEATKRVMNPTNVGAIFRSAAALGMDAVLLTPECSDPLYRRCTRVSMGTVFQIPWTYLPDGSWTSKMHQLGFQTAAMALREDSLRLDDPRLLAAERLAIALGTEGDGLADGSIESCDYTVCIPMAHGVDSLNVAAASAVAFYQLGQVRK